jgi:hypothetical protein
LTSFRNLRKHVLTDIQPYVCTFADCALHDHFFETQGDWYRHEMQSHRLVWSCNDKTHETFEKSSDFLNHMDTAHHSEIRAEQILALSQVFQHPSTSPTGVCTLCHQATSQLKSHVSRHLKHLALFAIPTSHYAVESDADDTDSEVVQDSHVSSLEAHVSNDQSSLSSGTTQDLLEQEVESLEADETETSIPPLSEADGKDGTSWDFATSKFRDARAAIRKDLKAEPVNPQEDLASMAPKLSEPTALSREEREARYRELRQRIFGSAESEETDASNETSEKTTKRTSTPGPVDDMPVMNPYHQQRPLCGASIGAYIDGQHLPPVSLGGIILVDGEPFGLTVHHILDAPSDDESDDEKEGSPKAEQPTGSRNTTPEDISRTHRTDQEELPRSAQRTLPRTKEVSVATVETTKRVTTENSQSRADSPSSVKSKHLPARDLELSDDESVSGAESFASLPGLGDGSDEEHGDILGITKGRGSDIYITQPAIDDVDNDFFPNDDDKDEDHLSSHSLGHIYASSGIRRWMREGVNHEIDWALIKIHEDRLETYNVVQGGRRFRVVSPEKYRPPLTPPVSRRHYTEDEDEYPVEVVVDVNSLGDLDVHSFGRTTGLQGGKITSKMNKVQIYRRKTFSDSWAVEGGCKLLPTLDPQKLAKN